MHYKKGITKTNQNSGSVKTKILYFEWFRQQKGHTPTSVPGLLEIRLATFEYKNGPF